LKKSLEIQPDFSWARISLATLYWKTGSYEQASEQCLKMISKDQQEALGWEFAGETELFFGNYRKAEEYIRKARDLASDVDVDSDLGFVLYKQGAQDQARGILDRARANTLKRIEQGVNSYVDFLRLARIYAIEGNKPEAYHWLQNAVNAGFVEYPLAAGDPALESLRGDAEFQNAMSQLKRKVDAMRLQAQKESYY
jgi:tetratricopeptide (TPR) repeat protein